MLVVWIGLFTVLSLVVIGSSTIKPLYTAIAEVECKEHIHVHVARTAQGQRTIHTEKYSSELNVLTYSSVLNVLTYSSW